MPLGVISLDLGVSGANESFRYPYSVGWRGHPGSRLGLYPADLKRIVQSEDHDIIQAFLPCSVFRMDH